MVIMVHFLFVFRFLLVFRHNVNEFLISSESFGDSEPFGGSDEL